MQSVLVYCITHKVYYLTRLARLIRYWHPQVYARERIVGNEIRLTCKFCIAYARHNNYGFNIFSFSGRVSFTLSDDRPALVYNRTAIILVK